MKEVVFITGNQKKAEYFAELIEYPIEHIKVDLIEIQSLDLKEVVRHKLHEAYAQIQRPVLVEDVAFEFTALGRLPGTFTNPFKKNCHMKISATSLTVETGEQLLDACSDILMARLKHILNQV